MELYPEFVSINSSVSTTTVVVAVLVVLLKPRQPPLLYGGHSLRSRIEAPLISREVVPETHFLMVIMAADAQAGPFLRFQASCLCGTL